MSRGRRWPLICTAMIALALLAVSAPAAVPGARHVVIVGFDGLSPDGVRKAKTPNLDRLMQRGAWTLHARGVMPTVSSPNWASMIMGAGPEQHGVTSNDWEPDKFEIRPTAVGSGGIFPTIFGVMREQRPSAVIAVFHDWEGFARLLEPKAPTIIEHPAGAENTMHRAIASMREKKPDFTFIHLDHIDHAGHTFGHGTPEYYAAVELGDRLVGELLAALRESGVESQTIVLITADHGGRGKGHGGATMAEIEIPWILAGPGVANNKEIAAPVNTYDTAATVAYIFGLKPPSCWIAKPVLAAFQSAARLSSASAR